MKVELRHKVKHFHALARLCACKDFDVHALPDGDYDVIIVDAHDVDDDNNVTSMQLELTITSGTRKGETLSLHAQNLRRDSISLLGLPATLHVQNGTPTLSLE